MIKIDGVTKHFGNIRSLDSVSAEIGDGSIFGLVGSNGSGKSTLLRVMSGIFIPDAGAVYYDGESVLENTNIKDGIIYLSDDPYFIPHSSINDMSRLYASMYSGYDMVRCAELVSLFGLDAGRKIDSFSKGMQKQAAFALALPANPRYLLCDETFDGLDPVMRQLVKRLLAAEVAEKKLTPIIASHNLREIDDICDHIGLLHKGGILFESEIDSLKSNIHTVQCVFDRQITEADFAPFEVVTCKQRSKIVTAVIKGNYTELDAKLSGMSPEFYEIIPLTLEEIFISEMEERGYDYSEIIF